MIQTFLDNSYMNMALSLAERRLGRTWPNPSVACVLIKKNIKNNYYVIGRGWTQLGGRPHAEIEALKNAHTSVKNATAYVTLEPCAHVGETPSCADALIDAGIRRVVIAMSDPDPRTNGQGIHKLKAAGLEVVENIGYEKALEINAGFVNRFLYHRPLVTLKIASTLDAKIANQDGQSQWITNEKARHYGHLLRSQNDGILIGAKTVLRDNPYLTCRLPGLLKFSPVRFVLDPKLNISLESHIVQEAQKYPTYFFTLPNVDEKKKQDLILLGVKIIEGIEESATQNLCLKDVLEKIMKIGITRILVEGGNKLNTNLVKQNLVDRIVWFRAHSIMGSDGLSALGSLPNVKLDQLPKLVFQSKLLIEDCSIEFYKSN
ncbi:MAG: bifunctional diaminohydroxyphosphoribosylaminopyrimidine deaminase/5-amino-6-(5-phosphoribosylamino)uracil reductase RibD [Alphaproteobacteria bacterium]|nr:bifunctional diaminohydroxyphosphoribosylaminopyrimidine deaminase/5-amino-6-(5-phosphoribosylamino)uracil reductase RibD [Alphaproteobacteria bacterium]